MFQEGPHSVLADDEFYDAVESGLDKMEEEQELRERLKSGQVIPITPPPTSPACQHRLWPEVSVFVFIQRIIKLWNLHLLYKILCRLKT